MNPLIHAKDIYKEYVNGDIVTPVLNGVTFDVGQGEFIALMGPSGSGKSTLMHILGFLDRLTKGTYVFDGRDVTTLSAQEQALMRRNDVGFIFQSFHLLPKSKVIDNVILPMVYAQVPLQKRRQAAEEALEAVGLSHRLDHLSNQLSGGERQRVAIARALVNKPKMLFADEPTGNLDTKSGEIVLHILQELNIKEGTTIVMVTHEQEAAEFAKRILFLRDGILISDQKVVSRRNASFHK